MALFLFTKLTLLNKQRLNYQSVSCHELEIQRQTYTHINRIYRAVANAPNCINVIEAYNSGFKPDSGGIN